MHGIYWNIPRIYERENYQVPFSTLERLKWGVMDPRAERRTRTRRRAITTHPTLAKGLETLFALGRTARVALGATAQQEDRLFTE